MSLYWHLKEKSSVYVVTKDVYFEWMLHYKCTISCPTLAMYLQKNTNVLKWLACYQITIRNSTAPLYTYIKVYATKNTQSRKPFFTSLFPSILLSGFCISDVLRIALSWIEILSFSWFLLKPFSSTAPRAHISSGSTWALACHFLSSFSFSSWYFSSLSSCYISITAAPHLWHLYVNSRWESYSETDASQPTIES